MLGVHQGRAAMTRKGGGGECPNLPGHETHSPPCGLASQGLSAANPAACMIGGPSCTQTRHDERIRALEAENRILTDAMRKEIAKVRALEAEPDRRFGTWYSPELRMTHYPTPDRQAGTHPSSPSVFICWCECARAIVKVGGVWWHLEALR